MFQTPTSEFQIVLKALSYFRTHWWVFLIEVIAIFTISMLQFYSTDPVYESNGTILIDSSRRQLYQSVMMPMNNERQARKQNMAHLLTSQEVMERFRTSLNDFYNAEGRPAFLRSFFPGGTPLAADSFRTWIVLTYDRSSDIYSFRCTAKSPEAAHGLCITYMNTVQQYYPEIGQRDVMMKREFLSRQINSLTRQLGEREFNLADFQKKNEDFINFIMMNIEGRGLQKLRGQVLELKQKMNTNRALKRLILDVPQAKRGEHTARDISITALTSRISELQYQLTLTRASEYAEDRDERVKRLAEEIARAEQQLAKLNEDEELAYLKSPIESTEVRKRLSQLELEYRTDTIKLRDLEREISEVQVKEKRYQQQRLEHDRLQAELIHKRKLLANLFQKEQETELELSAGNAEIFRLQEPTIRGHRIAPQLSKHIYSSLSLSIFAIVVTTILLIALMPRLDSEAEVHRLNLPVLGKVPMMRQRTHTLDELPSFGLEYLKIMNYRILRETKDIKCPVIVVSSPHSREGKSTTTSFLSIASQSPNRKTLLIDGDLITSNPNKFFGLTEDTTPGARAILESPTTVHPSTLIVKTMHEGINFMPRGGRIEPVAMPNYLKPMERYLELLRKEYDVIYIDTPPLFASNLAHQWSGLGDLIVLVARIFFTRPKDIIEAIQTCKIFSKAPVGVALNCLPMSSQQRRASNYYFSRKVKPQKLAA